MSKTYLNPQALFSSQQYGFSQGVAALGKTTVYVSGQVGWNAIQRITDPADLGVQTRGNNSQSTTERESSARSERFAGPYVIAMLYAASRSGKQSKGCRSSLSTAGFTVMWNDARSRASFGPITVVNLSTVVLKSLGCICCNSIVMVMSNNPLPHA